VACPLKTTSIHNCSESGRGSVSEAAPPAGVRPAGPGAEGIAVTVAPAASRRATRACRDPADAACCPARRVLWEPLMRSSRTVRGPRQAPNQGGRQRGLQSPGHQHVTDRLRRHRCRRLGRRRPVEGSEREQGCTEDRDDADARHAATPC